MRRSPPRWPRWTTRDGPRSETKSSPWSTRPAPVAPSALIGPPSWFAATPRRARFGPGLIPAVEVAWLDSLDLLRRGARGWAPGIWSGLAQEIFGAGFPYGTLIVELIGCFLIGAIAQMALSTQLLSPTLRLTLTTGFIAASLPTRASNLETTQLFQGRAWFAGLANLGASRLAGCFLAGLLGLALARRVFGEPSHEEDQAMRVLDGEHTCGAHPHRELGKWHHQPLIERSIQRLRREGFAGATILRGVAGFGAPTSFTPLAFSTSRRTCRSSSRWSRTRSTRTSYWGNPGTDDQPEEPWSRWRRFGLKYAAAARPTPSKR